MVKSGLVTKTKSPDEKMYRIYMTPEGEKLYNSITTDSIEMIFDFLTKKTKREFAGLLLSLYAEASGLLGMSQSQPLLTSVF
jgi:DNA-binding MarR family transcriptional regulator